MNKTVLIIGFVIMVAVQWFVPAKIILQQEQVLTAGTAYKFKTRPMDPSDPLRGKYISLNFEMHQAPYTGEPLGYGEKLHVYIENDDNGFAKAVYASKFIEETELDYVVANAHSVYNDSILFDLPFTTFYMEETKAYPAEILVREATRDSLKHCYGLVYVKDENAVLENVIVDDMAIKDYVEKHQKENAHKE